MDGPLFPGLVKSRAVLTNAAGVFDRPMAEWALMMVLAYVKELFENVEHQRRRRWAYREVGVLEGQRVLVVGAGGIGRDIARVLGTMGMDVRGVARSRREGDPDFGTVFAVGELDALLPWADFVVVALPLTPLTRGLFGAEQFSRMRSTARFINVGRGASVDEQALISALQQGRIAGAALTCSPPSPSRPTARCGRCPTSTSPPTCREAGSRSAWPPSSSTISAAGRKAAPCSTWSTKAWGSCPTAADWQPNLPIQQDIFM